MRNTIGGNSCELASPTNLDETLNNCTNALRRIRLKFAEYNFRCVLGSLVVMRLFSKWNTKSKVRRSTRAKYLGRYFRIRSGAPTPLGSNIYMYPILSLNALLEKCTVDLFSQIVHSVNSQTLWLFMWNYFPRS